MTGLFVCACGTVYVSYPKAVEEAWMEAAACHDSDPSLFYLDKGDNLGVRRAKAVCAGCPVRAECLEYALVHCEKFGVWGGMSERERRRERVRRRREGTLPAWGSWRPE